MAAEVIKVFNGTMQDVSVKDCLLALSSMGGQEDGLKKLGKFDQQKSLVVLQTKGDAKVLKPNYAYALVEYKDTRYAVLACFVSQLLNIDSLLLIHRAIPLLQRGCIELTRSKGTLGTIFGVGRVSNQTIF